MPVRRMIEIDTDVQQTIEAARRDYGESENDILRRLLGIADGFARLAPTPGNVPGAWHRKGVTLMPGAELRLRIEERVHHGFVRSGKLWFDGRPFVSPSRAATYLADTPRNGWLAIEVRPRGWKRWVLLDALRGEDAPHAGPSEDVSPGE